MTSESEKTGPEGLRRKEKGDEQTAKGIDVSGAIDVARHPRVATLELLRARHPFERHPRAQKGPSSPHLRLPSRADESLNVTAFAIFSSEPLTHATRPEPTILRSFQLMNVSIQPEIIITGICLSVCLSVSPRISPVASSNARQVFPLVCVVWIRINDSLKSRRMHTRSHSRDVAFSTGVFFLKYNRFVSTCQLVYVYICFIRRPFHLC